MALLLTAACVPLIRWQLDEHLGSKPYADTLQAAEKQNWLALDAIKEPQILVDIPASIVVPLLADELSQAISNAKLSNGWNIAPASEPKIVFVEHAIQANQIVILSNPKWGSATLNLTVNAIPHLSGSVLVIDTAVANVQVSKLDPLGIYLPGFVDSDLTAALDSSLDRLNSLMPSKSIPAAIPAQLVRQDLAEPAILVSPAAVTIMLGAPGGNGSPGKVYTDDYLAVARQLQPGYQPGSGIIAAIDKSQDISAAADQLLAQATVANLGAAQGILKMPVGADPSTIGPEMVATSALVSSSPDWLTGQIRQFVVNALAKFHSPDVQLSVPDNGVTVKTINGALEASADGTATFLNGAVSVQFSIVVWAVMQPSADGLQAKYALRDLKIKNVSASWEGRTAAFAVPYESALGSLVAQFIGTLPTSDFPIPALPITVEASANQQFKMVFAGNATTSVNLTGRAVLLSPRRIDVLASPMLAGQPVLVPPPSILPAAGQYDTLNSLMTRVETLLDGASASKQLELLVAKPAVGSLLESLFVSLNPHIEAAVHSTVPFDAGRIPAIPGEGSCNAPCNGVSSCGDIKTCTINVCSEVVTTTICNTICPLPLVCNLVCNPVKKLICKDQADNDCLNRINSCAGNVALCTAAWGSGLEATCHGALAALNAAGFTGLVELSGSVSSSISGETYKDAALKISSDLSALDLSLVASAQGTVDATASITWIQFGNLLLCPSGNLSGHFALAADPQPESLHASVTWTGGGATPLAGVVTPNDPTVDIHTSEPPIQTLVKSNPALLTCALGQVIVGLGVASVPHITQELLASALRKALGDKNGPIAAAIIDGRYSYTGHLSSFSFQIPSEHFDIIGEHIDAMPALTSEALTMSTAN